MIDLIKKIDPIKMEMICCFYQDYRRGQNGTSLTSYLKSLNIRSIILPQISEPLFAKICKELIRIFFFFNVNVRNFFLQRIDLIWRITKRAKQIESISKSNFIDLLYLNNQPSSNLEAYFAGCALNIPIVQHSRSNVLLSKYEIKIVNKFVYSIICNSNGVKKSLITQGINPSKLTVVYNGFNFLKLPAKAFFKKNKRQLILGTIGSLLKRKSIDHIIDALKIIRNSFNINAHLIIVGDGVEYERLRKYAQEIGVFEHITFTKFSEKPLSWLQLMDIFILSSKNEGFGRVIVEAMQCKKPVIASKSAGPSEIIRHKITGYLYSYGNINEMVSLIIKLAANKRKRTLMGKAGFERVKKLYDIDNYIIGVTKILERAIS